VDSLLKRGLDYVIKRFGCKAIFAAG
jgi:hypothetical protein